MRVPCCCFGEVRVDHAWCRDHHKWDMVVTITCAESADECAAYTDPQTKQGCEDCAKYYPGRAKDCMACGRVCWVKNKCDLAHKDECVHSDAFLGSAERASKFAWEQVRARKSVFWFIFFEQNRFAYVGLPHESNHCFGPCS